MITQISSTTQEQLKQQWRDSVRIVSGRAADTLGAPFLTRLHKAQDLVLRDCVQPQADGSYIVSGDSGRNYDVTSDYQCACPDAAKAPTLNNDVAACKHALSAMLHIKALRHMQKQMDAKPTLEAPASLPEAPASANVFIEMGGRRMQLTLRDVSEDKLIARMERLMARYPVQEAAPAPVAAAAAPKNGGRKVSELSDIECEIPGCGEFYWRNWDAEGKGSWLSHRAKDGSWHRYGKK